MPKISGLLNHKPQIFSAALLVLLSGVLLFGPVPAIGSLGGGDFYAYWSASYLLGQGKDFANPDLLLETEQTLTGWNLPFTLVTWNPPWLLALLLPYGAVSFERGKWLWLLTNITIVFVGSIWAWLACTQNFKAGQYVWVAPIIAFLFSSTLLTFIMGQVCGLVFWGLAGFLFWQRRNKPFIAGLFLVFTLVKPHLVYITLPLIMLTILEKRDRRFWAGFLGGILGLTTVVLILRPSFLSSYIQTVGGGNLLSYESPTLGGILDFAFGWYISKFIGFLVLPLAVFLWWRVRKKISLYTLTSFATFASVITVPFGWSYDAIVLLIPLLEMIVWLVEGFFSLKTSIFFAVVLVVLDAATYVLRVEGVNEVYYFWVPMSLAVVYLAMYRHKHSSIKSLPPEYITGS